MDSTGVCLAYAKRMRSVCKTYGAKSLFRFIRSQSFDQPSLGEGAEESVFAEAGARRTVASARKVATGDPVPEGSGFARVGGFSEVRFLGFIVILTVFGFHRREGLPFGDFFLKHGRSPLSVMRKLPRFYRCLIANFAMSFMILAGYATPREI